MKVNWLHTTEYPFQSRFFEVNGQRLHYIDEGAGEIMLFVHGTPSWSFDYRNVIKRLSTSYRCMAIDHIGFGLSSKPEHYDYSTVNHSQTLSAFILEKNLSNITLVVHDFGGPIGLNMAINHPERIKNIVILNSWLWSSTQEPEYIKLSRILKSPLLPVLYRYFNFSPKFILPQSFGEKKLSKALRSQFTKPFANKSQRNGTLAFARSLLNDQEWFEELWQQRHILAEKPVLLIWGMKDKFITPAYLQKFASGFPDAYVVELPTCGHFPQEEEPEKVADAIRSFVKDRKYSQPAQ
ncbi:alpha/beta fold hydrolase [Rhodocytophaga rosea]|uniref:Alpha/beta fold hydrolase n=1 Tax=Rhodocytophaga rosea TaxID=2704465 RepID=A0A6C0GG88_9BACT|nr:alpha/beta fold hydrolase [Rhodocytophaga rosea]QHT67061.1 alpha/beta fold hydrolase [Rhodocytophaga rosea]